MFILQCFVESHISILYMWVYCSFWPSQCCLQCIRLQVCEYVASLRNWGWFDIMLLAVTDCAPHCDVAHYTNFVLIFIRYFFWRSFWSIFIVTWLMLLVVFSSLPHYISCSLRESFTFIFEFLVYIHWFYVVKILHNIEWEWLPHSHPLSSLCSYERMRCSHAEKHVVVWVLITVWLRVLFL